MTARWQRVRSNAGYRLRLIGGNNEIVLVGEPLNDARSVETALEVANSAFNKPIIEASIVAALLDEIDERE